MDINPTNKPTLKFLSLSEVMNITSLSSTTIWREEKAGHFPKKCKLSANRIAWLHADIEEWITSKVEANS